MTALIPTAAVNDSAMSHNVPLFHIRLHILINFSQRLTCRSVSFHTPSTLVRHLLHEAVLTNNWSKSHDTSELKTLLIVIQHLKIIRVSYFNIRHIEKNYILAVNEDAVKGKRLDKFQVQHQSIPRVIGHQLWVEYFWHVSKLENH